MVLGVNLAGKVLANLSSKGGKQAAKIAGECKNPELLKAIQQHLPFHYNNPKNIVSFAELQGKVIKPGTLPSTIWACNGELVKDVKVGGKLFSGKAYSQLGDKVYVMEYSNGKLLKTSEYASHKLVETPVIYEHMGDRIKRIAQSDGEKYIDTFKYNTNGDCLGVMSSYYGKNNGIETVSIQKTLPWSYHSGQPQIGSTDYYTFTTQNKSVKNGQTVWKNPFSALKQNEKLGWFA